MLLSHAIIAGWMPMISPNQFWLCLHELASAANGEGYSDAERAANVVVCYHEMPPLAKREVLQEFEELLSFFLYVRQEVVASRTHDESKTVTR